MQTLKRGIVTSNGFDHSRVKREQVRLVLRVHLPYRLHFAESARLRWDVQVPCEVCFRNAISVPKETDIVQLIQSLNYKPRPLWTDALLILEQVTVNDAVLREFRTLQEDPHAHVDFRQQERHALNALNQSIIAYSIATKNVVGGGEYFSLTERDFFPSIDLSVFFLCEQDYVLEDSEVDDLFSYTLPGPGAVAGQVYSYTGNLSDAPQIDIGEVQRVLSRQQESLCYEFSFEARSYMLQGRCMIALLMACAALEAAHGTFFRHVFEQKLSGDHHAREAFTEQLLRATGFSALLQHSCNTLLEESERPSPEDLKAALEGIQIRNAIMHASVKKGKHRIRDYSDEDISRTYSAILKIHECFIGALDSELAQAE